MEGDIVFGSWEAIALIVNTICARIFLNFPRSMAEDAGTAGWLETVYFTIIAFLFFWLISRLYARFNRQDLLDIAELGGGGILRVASGLIILGVLLFIGTIILREYSENMMIIALSDSPISFVMGFFAVAMAVAAYLGLEGIVRSHAIVVPQIMLALLFILVAVVPYYQPTNLLPVLGGGGYSILGKGFFRLSTYSPLVYLFLLPPFIKDQKSFKTVGYAALGISAFLLLASVLAYLLVYPYPTQLEYFLPVFQLARLINYGRIFQRVESLFVITFAASAMHYLSAILFFAAHIFKKTFKLTHHRPLILPFTAIMFTLGLLPNNLMAVIDLEKKVSVRFLWGTTFVLPIILLLLAIIRAAPGSAPAGRVSGTGGASGGGRPAGAPKRGGQDQ